MGEGKQKLFFLPEAHTDFVLALVGEELGLAGTATVIVLFALLVWRGFQIAARARVPFGKYLGMGISRDRAPADERVDAAVRQLRRVFGGREFCRRRDVAEYFAGPARRRIQRRTR